VSLLFVPFFLVWKVAVLATRPRREATEFVRTAREPEGR
jgi:hypothetical protein